LFGIFKRCRSQIGTEPPVTPRRADGGEPNYRELNEEILMKTPQFHPGNLAAIAFLSVIAALLLRRRSSHAS
jgi:hypothetical protein